MSAEELTHLIDLLPPEKRIVVERIVEMLSESRSGSELKAGEGRGIFKHLGRHHLGAPIGDLSPEDLHEDG